MVFQCCTISDLQQKAILFNDFFFSSFNINNHDSPEITHFKNDNLKNLHVTVHEVNKILLELDTIKPWA